MDKSSDVPGAVYAGHVMHRRLQPFGHRFSYRVFSIVVDIDRIGYLARYLWLFSYNRFNILSFHDRDHGARDGSPLRPWIEGHLAEAGMDLGGGRITLISFPRLFGYAFNPLAVYLCEDTAGNLRAILYQVHNTFGDQHGYLVAIPAERDTSRGLAHSVEKVFHVSPFLPTRGQYNFRILPPGDRFSMMIREVVDGVPVLFAAHTANRLPLTNRTLIRCVLTYPMMTFKVMAAIYFEAVRLWRKGAQFHRRPSPPAQEVTR